MDTRIKKIIFTQEQIEKRIVELGTWVNEEYKNSKDLILVGLLKGSIPFLAQLIKSVKVDHVMDFMTVSSYEGKTSNTGNFKMVMDLRNDIYNKDVLIVEDIIDSGNTLHQVVHNLKERHPKSIKILTLLDKPKGREIDFHADKVGFEVPYLFLVGYGLDVKGKLRNLPYVAEFDKDKIDEI